MEDLNSDKTQKLLGKHRKIAIDTAPFIYHLEAHPQYSKPTETIFNLIETGKITATTSTITLMEILVKPKKEKNEMAVEEYRFMLLTFPNLKVRPMDANVAEAAAELRAKYPALHPPDAIQIGTAIIEGADAFITNDGKLKQVKDIKVILIKDLTGES